MIGIAVASKGIEDVCAREIGELINSHAEIKEGFVKFSFNKFEDLCSLCFRTQSAERVLYLLGESSFSDGNLIEKFGEAIKKIDFSFLKNDMHDFSVEIMSQENSVNTIDIDETLLSHLDEIIKKPVSGTNNGNNAQKIKMKFIILISKNNFYLGIDFVGFDLSKRRFRTQQKPDLLKPTIAYALVRMAHFSNRETLLEPLTTDGIISIEAGLYLERISPNHFVKDKFDFLYFGFLSGVNFDKVFLSEKNKKSEYKIYCYDKLLKNVFIVKKNAVAAGIGKKLHSSRVDLEWIDLKFKEKSVDKIVAEIPYDKISSGKTCRNFFNSASMILAKKGRIVLAMQSRKEIIESAEKYGFECVAEKEIFDGRKRFYALVIERK